jgi:hypothetical protein
MKKLASKAHNRPNFFSVLPTGQNQHKSHILFHENGSLHDFHIMTLFAMLLLLVMGSSVGMIAILMGIFVD